MQVVFHADSRRAFGEGSKRIFASSQEGCAFEFSVTAAEDADGDGCVVRTHPILIVAWEGALLVIPYVK